MIIEKEILQYLVLKDASILEAITKINNNKSRIIFVVSNSGVINGVVGDGDIRRWLATQSEVNLHASINNITTSTYFSANVNDSPLEIEKLFSDSVNVVPLIDKNNRIVAIAKQQADYFEIGDYKIGKEYPAFIIAEVGNNHNGDYDLAKKLVDEAVRADADCVKFQMRDLDQLYRQKSDNSNVNEDLGSEYVIDLLRKYQLHDDDMFRVFDYCHDKGIMPLCTPWDPSSIEKLHNYGLSGFKVASADLVNHHLLEKLIATRKPLICSTGMSREEEIIDSAKFLRSAGTQFSMLHCNSTYPAPFKDVNLAYLNRLQEIGQCVVGYSGHERGINVAIASLGFGARIIEKHLTLDRNMEGNDHKVSLLPDEFTNMVKGIREVEQSIGNEDKREITQGELMNREILGKSLVINCDLKKGNTIHESMIDIRSPGQGLPPYRKKEIIGKEAKHDFRSGDFFFLSDLEDNLQCKPRKYNFKRKWGIPVRFHDLEKLSFGTNPDLVEFHLSYKDLEVDLSDYLKKIYDMDLVIHAPELFSGDHILDLCSQDKEYRNRSINELQRVVDLTREIKKSFRRATGKTLIIVNAGGATQDAPIDPSKRAAMYKLIADSLSKIDQKDVEIIPQTMPPFPWHFGGQRYHNLFMDGKDITTFCKKYNYRICLDVSHSKLACNYHNWSFKEFIENVGPYSAHLHIVDAYEVDGEGVQIGEGEIDFPAMSDWLNEFTPDSSFIPEIWQGHKDNGSGFWYALNKLEQWL